MYAHHHIYPTTILKQDPKKISFDASGGYLLNLLCRAVGQIDYYIARSH